MIEGYFEIQNCPATEIIDQISAALSPRYNVELLTSGEAVALTFYDSFDWRLFQAGYILQKTAPANGTQVSTLRLTRIAGSKASTDQQAELAPGDAPGFAEELPEGPLADTIAPLLEMRTLLPSDEGRGQRSEIAIRNEDQKIVARLTITQIEMTGVDEQTSLAQLHCRPIRGYPKPFRMLEKTIQQLAASSANDRNLLASSLFAAAGREIGNYQSKLELSLHPKMNARQALRHILLHLLDQMCVNAPGTRTAVDSEFLHDFRIAVRRSRSAIGQFKTIFPLTERQHFSQELRWLGQVTGPTRDADVYLLAFDDYCAMLPEGRRDDLLPLKRFLRERQRGEQRKLTRALNSKRYEKFVADWRNFLCDDETIWQEPSLTPIKQLAAKRIWRLYRAICRDGEAITEESPDEALHDIRKEGKKLRYLLQFFDQLYPPSTVKPLARTLRTLQNILGDFQDYHVQSVALRGFADEMAEKKKAPPETIMAMGLLIEVLAGLQTGSRARFDEAFAAFSGPATEDRFRKLCGKKKRGAP
ncbi:MAG TPA: hypothetical protein DCO73_05585 [Alphaproteobacteria bacterium]|jgi:CHAD domain-containing protein|nr:hypothetical protein [Alphaproteobacteria bacterium]